MLPNYFLKRNTFFTFIKNMRNVTQIVALIKKVSGLSKDKEIEELMGIKPMGLASLKRENRVGSFLKFLVPYVQEQGLSVDNFLLNDNPEPESDTASATQQLTQKGEEDMWKDKYIEEMELNRKLLVEISTLKDELMGKQKAFAKKHGKSQAKG